jgi:Putative transmembrane protein 170
MTRKVPADYHAPTFPSLYNPAFGLLDGAYYLYDTHDIWRFTLFWTMVLYGSAHLAVALCAVAVQWRNWRVIWPTPLIYAASGGLEALLAGSIVGLMWAFPKRESYKVTDHLKPWSHI